MITFSYADALRWGAALLATLVLARLLTPASWWRQANAAALAVLVGGTWALASLFALWPAPNAGARAPVPVPTARAATSFVVHAPLNLRAAPAVAARRLATAPAGARLSATGQRRGDWWEVVYADGAGRVTGWASSLWLRRPDEARRAAADAETPP